MTTNLLTSALKPFVINQTDIQFILDQINFLPLFDVHGNAIINWSGTGTVYNSKHVAYQDLGSIAANIAAYGTSYQSVTDLAGLRDVTGMNNNLSLVNADWGAVDGIFTRSAAADYANYSPVVQAVAEYAYAVAKQYYATYAASGGQFNTAQNTDYAITVDNSGSPTQFAADGTAITIKSVVDYTPRMISLATTTAGVVYDTWANHQTLTDGSPNPDAASHTVNEIYYDASGVAKVLDWGQLATVADGGQGQVDTQERLLASAGQDDHFIGGLNPGVSPSNGFFVLFGQFFDHGLDFIGKSSGQTIKIALDTTDPLYGMTGSDGQPVHEITITRATVATVDANGAEYTNHTSPYIDQSQTYGSHEQLTTLLREWVRDPETGTYHAGMKLFDGTTLAQSWTKADGTITHDTLPTLDELRAHVEATGRDALTWEDVNNLRNRDASGHVIAGTSGSALLLDMNPRFDAGHLHGFYDANNDGVQGAGEANYGTAGQAAKVDAAIATIDAAVKAQYGGTSSFGIDATTHKLTLFLQTLPTGTPDGTPHTMVGAGALSPFVNFGDFSIKDTLPADIHSAVGEILMASVGDHYIAGDGRVNENFGLTSVHHIFHEEHNYQIDNFINALHQQDIVTHDTNHVKLHEFQIDAGHGMNGAGDYLDKDGNISWDQNKLFNAGKLIVEMEYQHAAVDQYARNVTPNIQEFVGYSSSVNADVTLEYAQAAFRFGHSTLRETIDTIDPTHGLTGKIMGYALKEAFLSPEKYQAVGPAGILLGMSHQQMNEVDEFITPALNQGLLGQPLDLAAINIARGRDLGIPTLNDFREAIGLARYTSWTDFGQNMQHPSSLVNFIAAYSLDGDVARAQGILDLVDGKLSEVAALALGTSLGWTSEVASGFAAVTARAFAFLEGGDKGFNHIDTWLGGLAEIHQPGGLLGETFDKVFVAQIEALMDGDRFYYLFRLAGQQFAEEVGNGQLKDIVERNTGLTHLNGNIFGYADKYYDFCAQKEVSVGGAETQTTSNSHKYGDVYGTDGVKIADGALTTHSTLGVYTNGGRSSAIDGSVVTINGHDYIRDTRLEDANLLNDGVNLDGTPNSGAESSEVLVGTSRDDLIYAQGGDDTVYGEDGADTIYGGFGIDRLYGGAGNDKLYGGDNPDLMDGGSGDDELYGESSGSDINGSDQIIGGSGDDIIHGGIGIDKLSGGTGDDRIYGDQDTDPFTHGSDGNDYVDGGSGGDIVFGDNGDDVVVGGRDQDQMFGGNGDDIIRPGDVTGALTIGTDEVIGGDGVSDEGNAPGTIGFDLVDFSDNAVRPGGTIFNLTDQQNPAVNANGTPKQIAAFQLEGVIGSAGGDTLTGSSAGDAGLANASQDLGENWLIGGSGADTLSGLGGNDIIIGGSIRLDTLIGKYNTAYNHNQNNTGLTAEDQLQDARYQGASHRVAYDETIDNSGLIDAVNATIAGTNNDFAKHFTEMLRSEMFKDTVLGDGGTDASTAANGDIAVFGGRFSDYKITAITFHSGNADGDLIAYKVEDLRDPNGVDANGLPIVTDGTDIVVGVEKLRFSDQDISTLNTAPVLDLHATNIANSNYADNFGSNLFTNTNGTINWTSNPWTETGDTTPNPATTGQILISNGQMRISDNGDGATIQRSVDLTGATTATLSFSYAKNSFDTGDKVVAQFSFDNGGTWHDMQTIAGTGTGGNINRDNGSGNVSVNLANFLGTGETFGNTGILRFNAVTSNTGGVANSLNNGTLSIDNVNVAIAKATPSNDGSNNYVATFIENGNGTGISLNSGIVDDGTILQSAKAAMAIVAVGDTLRVNNSSNASGNVGGIGYTISSVGGVISVDFTGSGTLAQYQAAIDSISYRTTSENPTAADRIVNVSVNDGLLTSNIATATIHVTPVNDAPNAGADRIITNYTTSQFSVADWALLNNDTDAEGQPISITGVNNPNSLSVSHLVNGPVLITDTGNSAGGSFRYAVSDGSLSSNGNVTVTRDVTGPVNGTINNDILVGDGGNSQFVGGLGSDIIFAGDGNDTITWNANILGITDGRDIVDGGDGTDTFIVNGDGSAEIFRIYSNKDVTSTGLSSAANAGLTGLKAGTEIVITREVAGVVAVISELTSIQEITINTGAGNDQVIAVGDFNPTSLAFNTITVSGDAGNDKVDITNLTSAHRIVFHGGTGTNEVVGTVRPQDVVDGTTASGGSSASSGLPADTGSSSSSSSSGSGSSSASTSTDTTTTTDTSDDQSHNSTGTANADVLVGHSDDDVLSGGAGDDVVLGNDGDDTLSGGAGDDVIKGDDGKDIIFGGADHDALFGGSGSDVMFGDAGNDRMFGDSGNDTLEGGVGSDSVYGGEGDDRVIATLNDGDDVYWGDAGQDTLDYSAITARLTVELGNGSQQHGSVVSTLSGNDTIFGFENVMTGSGDDTIIASSVVNVMDGGQGNNTFVFRSVQDANHDTINGFNTGDKIDLSGIDANEATAGNQSFVLFAGTAFTAAGQVLVTHEVRDGADHTIITGNTNANLGADFEIDLTGNHHLVATDFTGVN